MWPSARLRTEQAIFSSPLRLNSLFSHRSPENCSVSLYVRHPDGAVDSGPARLRGRGGAAVAVLVVQRGLKHEATEKQLIKNKSQNAMFGFVWFVFRGSVDIPLLGNQGSC